MWISVYKAWISFSHMCKTSDQLFTLSNFICSDDYSFLSSFKFFSFIIFFSFIFLDFYYSKFHFVKNRMNNSSNNSFSNAQIRLIKGVFLHFNCSFKYLLVCSLKIKNDPFLRVISFRTFF